MEKKVYLVGNAHLDLVWLWEWYEGYTEIKATFRSALDRMNEFPDFKFTAASAQYYEWIKESDPKMFSEIVERVKENRWCIAGGQWVQPDCNIPCDESFARHSLISQRFFKKEFGKIAITGYNVDSFGHNQAIPKILDNSGITSYVFMRPGPHENPNLTDLFNWESDDGSSVLSYRIHERYNIMNSCTNLFEEALNRESNCDKRMAFYGVGNHGGGPTIALLNKMHDILDENYIYSTVDNYFNEIKDYKFPTWNSDLQFHAKGCYSACSQIKKNNRKSENMILSCENYSVLSNQLVNTPYPSKEIERAWKNILLNQFHDVLAGCCIKEAYDSSLRQHGEAQSIADRNINFALQQISWNIDTLNGIKVSVDKPEWGASWLTDKIGTPFVVFNSHPWEITQFVQFRSKPTRITDINGVEIPTQIVRASQTNVEDKWEVGLNVTVPALGYVVLRAFFNDDRKDYENKVMTSDTSIENEFLKIEFNPQTGEIIQILNKETNKNILSEETQTVMIDETDSDTWSHRIEEFKKVDEIFASGDIHVTEVGPLRATMRTYQRGKNTTIRRDYSIVSGNRQIFVKTQIDFHEKHKMLKFRFPIDAKSPEAINQIQYGTIKRPINGTEQPCQKWCGLVDKDNSLIILNDSKYSFDCDKNVLSMTVLRGAIYADHYGNRDEFCEYMEQGLNEFSYAIMPFTSIEDINKKAAELNTKPFTIIETFHNGSLPLKYSGINVKNKNILVTAIKKHEDSDGIIVRAFECEGKDTNAEICIFNAVIKTHFKHNEVKTFLLNNNEIKETNFLEFM